jgi:N-acetylglucosamine kinase-like BadF-type ATPase
MVTVGVDLGGTNVYAVVLDGEQVRGRAKLGPR